MPIQMANASFKINLAIHFPCAWVSAFKDKLPEDLEVVLKTGLIELKAKKFDWRRPAEELEKLLKSGEAETLDFSRLCRIHVPETYRAPAA